MEAKHKKPSNGHFVPLLSLLLALTVVLMGLGVFAARNARMRAEAEAAEAQARAEEEARLAAEEESRRAEEERQAQLALEAAMAQAQRETYEGLDLDFSPVPEDGVIRLEYADATLPVASLVSRHTGELSASGEIDLSRLGDTEFTLTLTQTDAYGQPVSRDFPVKVRVEDETTPEIEFAAETLEVEFRGEFDPEAAVVSVADPVDGELSPGATLREGEYTVTSNVDPETPGEYAVTVEAMDRHGNTSAASCPVTVLPKRVMERPELRGLRYGDAGLPYVVLINRIANTVTVCTKDEEGDTVPVKAMVCSTGPATPRAGSVYRVAGRWRWLGLFGPCYGQYATQIVGNILFHSVPYFTQDPSDLEYEEYNQLGTACSMGCIRLTVEDALWIYENVPRGTYVVFYNDADNPGPLGKPTPPTIDVNSPNRGWDPTDPDPENPWHKDASAAPPAGEAGEGEANDGEAAPDTP